MHFHLVLTIFYEYSFTWFEPFLFRVQLHLVSYNKWSNVNQTGIVVTRNIWIFITKTNKNSGFIFSDEIESEKRKKAKKVEKIGRKFCNWVAVWYECSRVQLRRIKPIQNNLDQKKIFSSFKKHRGTVVRSSLRHKKSHYTPIFYWLILTTRWSVIHRIT